MDYQLSGYQLICRSLKHFSNCPEPKDYVSGCFCTNNYALQDGMCVETCPGEAHTSVIFIFTFSNSISYYVLT